MAPYVRNSKTNMTNIMVVDLKDIYSGRRNTNVAIENATGKDGISDFPGNTNVLIFQFLML